MATTKNVSVFVYYNGECGRNQNGVFFQSDEKRAFMISTKSTLAHLKERIVERVNNLGDNKVISGINYRFPVVLGSGNYRFESVKIKDDEDVQLMFDVHSEFPAICSIELYVTFEDGHLSRPQPSSSTNAPYPRLQPQEISPHFCSQSQSSSSTCAPYARRVDEEESITLQEVSDESENESDYARQLFGSDDDFDDDEEGEDSQHFPLRAAAYNPPSHMSNLDWAIVDQPTETLRLEPRLPVDAGIEVGMHFHDKADCVRAIRNYHIKKSLDYVVKQSDQERYVIKCVHSQCPFSLRASYRKKSEHWVIGRISGSHDCASSALSHDHHPKLDSNFICDSIVSLLHSDLSAKVNFIIAHIKEKFNYTITYQQAWNAKNKAIEKIYGNWEQSYHDLPQWLMVMQSYLPGTVVQMETLPATLPNGSLYHGNKIFHRLFWAFNLCIKGFSYCKQIVQVDGTWLCGKYKGTLLIAVSHDGNNDIYPLAFAVVEGETKDAWSFFLKNLRRHVTPQPNICLISDMNQSIKSAYDNPENGWNAPPSTHVYCVRHIAQNFMREIQDKQLRETVFNMGDAINEPLFQKHRDEIRLNNLEALRWVDNIPREKWTRAYDGGRRWGHMTTNIVETMDSVLKDTRSLPITALVQSTYYRCAELFARRGKHAATMLDSGEDYTEQCMNHIKDALSKANTHQVIQLDPVNHIFSVRETVNHDEDRTMTIFIVNLLEKSCDCGQFQTLHLPCSHVIAACSSVHQSYQPYISDVYKVANVFRIYDESFQVVQNKHYWPQYQGDKLSANPKMRRINKGRPKSAASTSTQL